MRIDIWSDIVCPWCYIGKRRLERALAKFPQRDQVEVVHHAYQLDPTVPQGVTKDRREMLQAKYDLTADQVDTMDERLERLAADDGLDFALSRTVSGNTYNAHRLVQLARTHQRQNEMVERLYRAYFSEGRSVFDIDSLVTLAAEAGLDPNEARRVLEGDGFEEEVLHDREAAAAMRVRGVPFFVFADRYAISGAQPLETFTEALNRAWSETARVS
jgi:predicted DsbA family dithiol-disulfide isomerase